MTSTFPIDEAFRPGECPARDRASVPGNSLNGTRPKGVASPGAHGCEDAAMAPFRFYEELAAWWPLISPPEDYVEEAAMIARLLDGAAAPVHEVLELGSGGGHNAVHLTARFDMTLVDLSAEMLA